MSTDQTPIDTPSHTEDATYAIDQMANYAGHSLAVLNHSLAHSLSMAMHNAVSAQQNAHITRNAATSATCARILAVGRSGKKISVKKAEPTKKANAVSTAGTAKRK